MMFLMGVSFSGKSTEIPGGRFDARRGGPASFKQREGFAVKGGTRIVPLGENTKTAWEKEREEMTKVLSGEPVRVSSGKEVFASPTTSKKGYCVVGTQALCMSF